MEEKNLRVVVCGTRFGRVYLKGIEKLKGKCTLVGILARGSAQAEKCAKQYNVPLYTDPDQITKENVDIVCVVIRSAVLGGKGTELSLKMLEKGISVIQEHPVHYEDVVKCKRAAIENNAYYKVNGFYPNLKTVGKFIETSRKLLEKSEILYIDAACSMQVLYPLVDILGQAIGGFKPWSLKLDNPNDEKNIFASLSGELKGIPLNLRVMNAMDTSDPDNHTHLLHRITLETTKGTLMLTDSNGTVLWNPSMYVPHNEDNVLDLYGDNEFLDFNVSEAVLPLETIQYRNVYNDLWPNGIAKALSDFRTKILERQNDSKNSQYELAACEVWNKIGDLIGPAKIVKGKNSYPSSLREVLE